MNSHALGKLTAALLAAFALTACGGDDNDDNRACYASNVAVIGFC